MKGRCECIKATGEEEERGKQKEKRPDVKGERKGGKGKRTVKERLINGEGVRCKEDGEEWKTRQLEKGKTVGERWHLTRFHSQFS